MILERFLVASLWLSTVTSTSLKSSLLVHSPKSLSVKGGYVHGNSMFGKDPVMGGLSHRVYYSKSTCQQIDRSKGLPKRDTTGKNHTMEPFQPPFILLLDRSEECTFVTQARYAQHAGASGLVIMDNRCICGDLECAPSENCQPEAPPLADDGSGGDISIPVVSVEKQTGELFKKTLQEQEMLMELRYDYKDIAKTEKIMYHLWTTPTDSVSRFIFKELGTISRALHEHAYLAPPHPVLHSGHGALQCGPGEKDTDVCKELCTNEGRYCATSSFEKGGITGAQAVAESLRRACISENYHHHQHFLQFWEYVYYFQHDCYHNEGKFSDQACINNALEQAKMDPAVIYKCMKDSGGTDTGPNKLLEEEVLFQMQMQISRYPVVMIKDRVLPMTPSPINVLRAICEELDWRLPVCRQCGECYDDVGGCIELGSCKAVDREIAREDARRKEQNSPFWKFLKACFLLGAVGSCGYVAWIYSHQHIRGSLNRSYGTSFLDQGHGGSTDYMHVSQHDRTGDFQPPNGEALLG